MKATAEHLQPREVHSNKYLHKYSPWITPRITLSRLNLPEIEENSRYIGGE